MHLGWLCKRQGAVCLNKQILMTITQRATRPHLCKQRILMNMIIRSKGP